MDLDAGPDQVPASTPVYTVLLADVTASRGSRRRDVLQARLLRAVAELNDAYADALASPADLTSGDEIQALLRRPSAAYHVAVALQDRIRPAPLHIGIGMGPLSTGRPGDPVRHLDGPVFHHARDALGTSRRDGRAVPLGGFGLLQDQAAAALSLCWQIRQGWTGTQRGYVQAYERHRVMSDAAAALGVSKSAVSQSLAAARYRGVHALETETLKLLDKHGGLSDG